jgi:hypothetical protein
MNSKHDTTVKFIEDDYNFRLHSALKEKDVEISRLVEKIDQLLEANQKLSIKVDENLMLINDMKQNYLEKVNTLQNALEKKDLEIVQTKQSYEGRLDELSRSFDDEKTRMISSYEESLSKLSNGHSSSKDKLSMIINERERDLKVLLEKQQVQERHYNDIIDKLKGEISSHKENILNRKFLFIK